MPISALNINVENNLYFSINVYEGNLYKTEFFCKTVYSTIKHKYNLLCSQAL